MSAEASVAQEQAVYRAHGADIIAAIHDVQAPEHDGRVCDNIASSVGRLVARLVTEAEHRGPRSDVRAAVEAVLAPCAFQGGCYAFADSLPEPLATSLRTVGVCQTCKVRAALPPP